MSSEAPTPDAGARRLHPAEVVFAAGDALRDLLLPIVVTAVVGGAGSGGSGRGLALAALGALAGVVLAAARWSATRYDVTAGDARFRSGIVSPDEVVVPAPRIGSVDVVEGPAQRLFGVVELQIHVAGGGDEPEIRLRAVSRAEARRIQHALGHAAAGQAPPVFALTPRRLVVAALTGPSLGLLVPVAGAVSAVVGPALQGGGGERLAERIADSPGLAVAVLAGVLALAAALAVLGAVVAFAGFEVRVDGDRLRIRRGLVQRHAGSLPLDRVHAVVVEETPLRQALGLVGVRLETASARDRSPAVRTLVPVATRAEAAEVLRRALPALGWTAAALERPPRRARRRYLLAPVAAALAVAAAVTAVLPAAWPLLGVLPAVAAVHGVARFADAGWALEPERVVFRERRLARRTTVARRRRLQDLTVRSSPLQRRARLADLVVRVGSGAAAGVRHLDSREAGRLFAALRPRHDEAEQQEGPAARTRRGPRPTSADLPPAT
jgi:putative membrane protein